MSDRRSADFVGGVDDTEGICIVSRASIISASFGGLLFVLSGVAPAKSGVFELEGSVVGELRFFPESPAYGDPDNPIIDAITEKIRKFLPKFVFPFTGQDDRIVWPSVAFYPRLTYEWNNGGDTLALLPFGRYDPYNGRRSHFDLREAYWLHAEEDWDFLFGVDQVFWGVTESRHLVDVINQDDFVEDIGYVTPKLGQPMLNLNVFGDWGELSFFYLPYFRERTFPSNNARLRGPLPIDTEAAEFQSDLKEWHPDFALRYANTWDAVDFGLSFFRGTSREPNYVVRLTEFGISTVPTYDIMTQFGLDALVADGNMLWKLEALGRLGQGTPFFATAAGFEYTFFDAFESDLDVGLLGEYLYDGRDDDAPPTIFDNDFFVGTRLTFNDVDDTNILTGAVIDVESQHTFFNFEAYRRIAENWQIELDARLFLNVPTFGPLDSLEFLKGSPDQLEFVAKDSYVQIRLARFFQWGW